MQNDSDKVFVPWREIRTMAVGASFVCSISRMSTVRAMCTRIAREQDKVFRTTSNREERTLSVLRTR
jgi:hypothetical protein